MTSEIETVKDYVASLPEDRRKAIAKVRATIRKHLPKGYKEELRWGMICYEVPLRVKPDTYNGKPLQYAALASQKNHMAVYLNGVYADDATRKKFEKGYADSGCRMDMGKSCVRFKKLADLPLDVVGEAIAAFEVSEFVAMVEKVHTK